MASDMLDFATIARRLILFEHRVEEGMVQFPFTRGQILQDKLLREFCYELERDFPDYRLDDITALLVDFLCSKGDGRPMQLADWYQALLDDRSISLIFDNGEPRVRAAAPRDWMDICGWIDADALIALQFARFFRGHKPTAEDLRSWGVFARVDCSNVVRVPAATFPEDLHVHLSACESAPILWQDIVSGTVTLEEMPAYSGDRYGDRSLLRGQRKDVVLREKQAIRTAIELRKTLARRSRLVVDRDALQTPLAKDLWNERVMLIAAWKALNETSPSAARSPNDGKNLASQLDAYLFGKNLFIRRHVQGPGANPGLEAFRRYFDYLKPNIPRKSREVQRRRLKTWLEFAFDAPHLNAIELRISPFKKVAEYRRYLTDLQSVIDNVQGNLKLPSKDAVAPKEQDISLTTVQSIADEVERRIRAQPIKPERKIQPRILVHFIRPQNRSDAAPADLDVPKLRRQLDRETATLRNFLSDKNSSDLNKMIVGIDIANVERNAPIEYFAPYLKLLRMQQPNDVQTTLIELPGDCFPHWKQTFDAKQESSPARVPILGMTLHAGEDYYHPLIGLREVWNAIKLFKMTEGDRLGHALALGADFDRFARLFGTSTSVPQGQMLDALVWFHRRLGAVPDADPRTRRLVEDLIDDLTRKIFGELVKPNSHMWCMHLRQYPLSEENMNKTVLKKLEQTVDNEAMGFARDEVYDPQCRAKRAKLIPAPTQLMERWVIEDMIRVQNLVIEEVCRIGVVIEINPTSNRSIGDFEDMTEHPILKLVIKRPDLKVAVCCDDPGNFNTRIENEFALVEDGLRKSGLDAHDVTSAIEKMINNSRRYGFGAQGR